VESRKQLWRGQRRATPPQWLPKGGWLDRIEGWMPATSADQTGNVLTGIGASGGIVTATARVLAGPQDFSELHAGEILVAGITTPAWTSLFARASGVITDVGGPLSHSSIVAREYGIPAVLGTAVATRLIRSGQRVTVDGDAGTVTLMADGDQPEGPETASKLSAGPPSAVALSAEHRSSRLVVGAAISGAAAVALLGWQIRRRRAAKPRHS
jgi:pyruvate,water dikinase